MMTEGPQPSTRGDFSRDNRSRSRRRSRQRYRGRHCGLPDAVRTGAVLAKQRRWRGARAVHPRQHVAGIDGAERRWRDRGSDPRGPCRTGRGPGEPLLPDRRHRQNASPARSADAEAGAGRGGRKPRCIDRRHAVMETDARGDRMRRAAYGCSFSNWQRSARARFRQRAAPIIAMDHVVVSTA